MKIIYQKSLLILLMLVSIGIFITTIQVKARHPRSITELTTVLNAANSSARDIRVALEEFVYIRSPESCLVLKNFLQTQEANLPAILPDVQGFASLEVSMKNGTLPSNHWMYSLTHALDTVVSLTQIDQSEADLSVSSFMQHLNQKYAATEAGKLIVDLFRNKISGAKADVKQGVVPWKTGLNDQPEG